MDLLRDTADVIRLDDYRPEAPARRGRPTKSLRERFEAMRGPKTACGCRLWLGKPRQSDGYGVIAAINPHTGKPTMRAAHRVAMELKLNRTLLPEEKVLHKRGCPKTCVEQSHLRLGTMAENSADAIAEGVMRGRRLNPKKAVKLFRLYNEENWEVARLAAKFDVSHVTVKNVITGKTFSKHTGVVRGIEYQTGRPRKGDKRPYRITEKPINRSSKSRVTRLPSQGDAVSLTA